MVFHWDYNSEHTDAKISGIIDLAESDPHYYQKLYRVVSEVNNHLMLRGKRLERIRCFGYRVIQPDEYTGKVLDHTRRGLRTMRKGLTVGASAPYEAMTDGQRDKHDRTVTTLSKTFTIAVSGYRVAEEIGGRIRTNKKMLQSLIQGN